MKTWGIALTVLLAAGCGMEQSAKSTAAPPTTQPSSQAPRATKTPPMFATPEAAMTYLAAAWNDGDLAKLKKVTDPSARGQLIAMHQEATNLKLNKCTYEAATADYMCTFTHDFPAGYKHTLPGVAGFRVGPADKPGFYMTVYAYCGEGDA